ncbi:MAG: amidoligase family protein [Bacillota bacterium]
MPGKLEYEVKWNKKRMFGIEFEFSSTGDSAKNSIKSIIMDVLNKEKSSHSVEIRGWEHTVNNHNIWVCKPDSSCGLEVCTPPLKGPNDLKLVGKVVDALKANNIPFNNNCGLHVHLDLSDFSEDQMYNLLMYWVKIEHNILYAHPEHRRNNNRYCEAAINKVKNWVANKKYTGKDLYQYLRRHRGAINPCYWDRRSTMEFRMGEMTLDSESVKNRVRFFILFADTCKLLVAPDNLNLFSPLQMYQMLGLYNDPEDFIQKKFSPAMNSMRHWLLDRMIEYMTDSRLKKYHDSLIDIKKNISEDIECTLSETEEEC